MASFEPASWVQQANAVEFEEYERGSKCGPFVAVHKWVVLTENGISRPTAGNHRGFSDNPNPKSKIQNRLTRPCLLLRAGERNHALPAGLRGDERWH